MATAVKASKPKRSYGLSADKLAAVIATAKEAKKAVPNPYRPSSSYAACIDALAACGKLGQFFDVKTICEHYAKVCAKEAFGKFKNREPRENGLTSWRDKVCQNCTTLTRQKDYGLAIVQCGFRVARRRTEDGVVQFALMSI